MLSNSAHPVSVLDRKTQQWIEVAQLEVLSERQWRLSWDKPTPQQFTLTDIENLYPILTEFNLFDPRIHDSAKWRQTP